jgi:hypothetical protein
MSYSISNVKSDLDGILHGTTTNKISNITNLFNRAARQLLEDVDPQETKQSQQIVNALYDKVYDYAVPEDLKGNKIIDIKPQVNRSPADKFSQVYSVQFDAYKDQGVSPMFQTTFNNGTKFVRVKKDVGERVTLNECDAVALNGTWTAGGDSFNVATDNFNYVSGSGSIKFDVSGATTFAQLVNSTMTAVDLTDHEDEASLFCWVWLPDASTVSNVNVAWGSGVGNTWDVNSTTQHFGAFQDGWNLIRSDWNGAGVTGVPDASAVDYIVITFTYDGVADTNYRVDNFVSCLGEFYNMEYYSKYIFRDGTTSVWKEETDDDADLINLDTDSYNLYLYKVAEMCSQQSERTKDDTVFFQREYLKAMRRYKSMYKSEVEKPKAPYYRMPGKSGTITKIKP